MASLRVVTFDFFNTISSFDMLYYIYACVLFHWLIMYMGGKLIHLLISANWLTRWWREFSMYLYSGSYDQMWARSKSNQCFFFKRGYSLLWDRFYFFGREYNCDWSESGLCVKLAWRGVCVRSWGSYLSLGWRFSSFPILALNIAFI